MAFEGLANRLQNTMAKIRGKGKVSEADVKEMMRKFVLLFWKRTSTIKSSKTLLRKSAKGLLARKS